eukprot:jgi/Botrbrau1/6926/Bobra.0215s0006.2
MFANEIQTLQNQLSGIADRLALDNERIDMDRQEILSYHENLQIATRAFNRSRAWREASRLVHGQGQPLPKFWQEHAMLPIELPSPVLDRVVNRLMEDFVRLERILKDLERGQPKQIGPGAQAMLPPNEALKRTINKTWDIVESVAGQLGRLRDRVSDLQNAFLARRRQAGDYSDPFERAARTDQQSQEATEVARMAKRTRRAPTEVAATPAQTGAGSALAPATALPAPASATSPGPGGQIPRRPQVPGGALSVQPRGPQLGHPGLDRSAGPHGPVGNLFPQLVPQASPGPSPGQSTPPLPPRQQNFGQHGLTHGLRSASPPHPRLLMVPERPPVGRPVSSIVQAGTRQSAAFPPGPGVPMGPGLMRHGEQVAALSQGSPSSQQVYESRSGVSAQNVPRQTSPGLALQPPARPAPPSRPQLEQQLGRDRRTSPIGMQIDVPPPGPSSNRSVPALPSAPPSRPQSVHQRGRDRPHRANRYAGRLPCARGLFKPPWA